MCINHSYCKQVAIQEEVVRATRNACNLMQKLTKMFIRMKRLTSVASVKRYDICACAICVERHARVYHVGEMARTFEKESFRFIRDLR